MFEIKKPPNWLKQNVLPSNFSKYGIIIFFCELFMIDIKKYIIHVVLLKRYIRMIIMIIMMMRVVQQDIELLCVIIIKDLHKKITLFKVSTIIQMVNRRYWCYTFNRGYRERKCMSASYEFIFLAIQLEYSGVLVL